MRVIGSILPILSQSLLLSQDKSQSFFYLGEVWEGRDFLVYLLFWNSYDLS